jgi:hypothetical protein
MCFTGLCEVLKGGSQSLFVSGAHTAFFALLLAPPLFLGLARLSYQKSLRVSPEKIRRSPQKGLTKPKKYLDRIFNTYVLRRPTERAVYAFLKRSLQKSPLHRLQLMTLVALSLGLALLILAYLLSNQADLRQINKGLLLIPLIFILILLLGIKNVVNIPVSLSANWVFQLTENPETRIYRSGLKKGIIILIVIPLLLIFYSLFFFLWGGSTAFLIVFFALGLALILLEGLFWNYNKIPFACSYMPGKAKIPVFAAIYFFAFLIYSTLMSSLVWRLLHAPLHFPSYLLSFSLLLYGMHIVQNRKNTDYPPLQFEEDPDILLSLFARDE